MFVHLTLKSSNTKTGPIPVSTSSSDTCPPSCPFIDKKCYAKSGPLAIHWSKVSSGEREVAWQSFLKAIRGLPENQLWRHNQAGDLPGVGEKIDARRLQSLVTANRGRCGFTYTHKPTTPANLKAIRAANADGFTINLSANSLAEADALLPLGIPTVAVVPRGSPDKGTTPAGNRYLVCPAQRQPNVNCANCMLCQNRDPRRPIIAFEAHGSGAKRIEATLL